MDKIKIQLRTCPSCGGQGKFEEVAEGSAGLWRIVCENAARTCPARFRVPPRQNPEDAAKLWNTRAYDKQVRDLMERMKLAEDGLMEAYKLMKDDASQHEVYKALQITLAVLNMKVDA